MPAKHPTKSRSTSGHSSGPWNRRLKELAAFKKKHGHCRVPPEFGHGGSLARWVAAHRHSRRKGTLSAERVRSLDALGFSWDVAKESRWDAKYQALAAYWRTHGHCRVPAATGDCPGLARWVSVQRHARRAGTLSAERVRRLDELDFVWDGWEEQWSKMYAALVRYQKSHGECDVPRDWRRNPKLADWVARQRKFNRRGTLPPHRRRLLEALGFRFSFQEPAGKGKAKSRPGSATVFGPIGGSRRLIVVGGYMPR